MADQGAPARNVDIPTAQEIAHPPQDINPKELTATTHALLDSVRQIAAGPRLCKYFCKGGSCKYCDPEKWNTGTIVRGIYATWITHNVMAMSRPSDALFESHGMIEQFKRLGITAVFNLQECGEHASCGTGNVASGFSYTPEKLMKNDIYVYNFCWRDFGVPTLMSTLDMVKVLNFCVQDGGKVSVHCHAGMGRTGMLIACYLVYAHGYTADQAICHVRRRRKGTIQTKRQMAVVYSLERGLKEAASPFGRKSLNEALSTQRVLLHGQEMSDFRFVPKIVSIICERLNALIKDNPEGVGVCLIYDVRTPHLQGSLGSLEYDINRSEWANVKREMDPAVLLALLFKWLSDIKQPLLYGNPLDDIYSGQHVHCCESWHKGLVRTMLAILQLAPKIATSCRWDQPLQTFLYLRFAAAFSQDDLWAPKILHDSVSEIRPSEKDMEEPSAQLRTIATFLELMAHGFETDGKRCSPSKAKKQTSLQVSPATPQKLRTIREQSRNDLQSPIRKHTVDIDQAEDANAMLDSSDDENLRL